MNHTNIELNIEATHVAADIGDTEIQGEAYNEGAFFADTDWPWALKDDAEARPASMAAHLLAAWVFISGTVCPEWNNERARRSFILGYEDRATELADAGEAGYEALAEAGTVADTDGWTLQCEPWAVKATDSDKGLRAVQAAWAGAAHWQAQAEATGEQADAFRAIEALIRAEAAGEYMLDSRYVKGAASHTH
ncbi:MAG TPA: hypothetical protein VJU59_30945 [Paraburkholderia sp.]|uniref:hypothetical protein n=1 Tax=Paraburkholderia sp. TaxID=1926495 RepID=UPI002B47A8DA|nr:hypothetical protein [Paraburkholderia sp.]HKR44045.1 hypothetical protein [Paraburkholderia sp.]